MTVREGITIQQDQISDLAIILNPRVTADLRVEAGVRNAKLATRINGRLVWRGDCLLEWVQKNWARWA